MSTPHRNRLRTLLLFATLVVRAHAAVDAPPEITTFKSNSRAVLVDVVVTDRQGRPVHGLQARDLTIFDKGKPQTIVAFEEHRSDAVAKASPPPDLPKNVFTNYLTRSESGALTVLLFDSLNTSPHDLLYARKKMLDFLQRLPPGAQVALYAMGSRLRLVHGFAENSEDMVAAARALSTNPHPSYSNTKELSAALDDLEHSGLNKVPGAVAKMSRFLGEDYEGMQQVRLQDTLDMFAQLARSLTTVPGRKNLIWISSAFPVDFSSDSRRLQRVAALLAANRIAVYPIDARGVLVMGPDAQARGSEVYAARSQGAGPEDAENAGIIETMRDIADITGGQAHYNDNYIDAAMADSVRAGSSYYSLAYRPAGVEWNGQFRRIKIKINPPRPHLKLVYRSGYYAVSDPSDLKEDPTRLARLAMDRDVPVSTQFVMKARVLPPDAPDAATQVDIFIDLHDLALTEVNGSKTPEVDFLAAAWDREGKLSGGFSQVFHTQSDAEYQSLLRTGLRVHQDMLLKPGSYQLRLGVMDRLSGRIGTLDVPVTIPASAK